MSLSDSLRLSVTDTDSVSVSDSVSVKENWHQTLVIWNLHISAIDRGPIVIVIQVY